MAKKIKESKHDIFLRLGRSRTRNVLKALRILGNCSNKHTYEYAEVEVESMFDKIEEYLGVIKSKFMAVKLEQDEFDF